MSSPPSSSMTGFPGSWQAVLRKPALSAMWKRLLPGILLGIFLGYLSLKDVHYEQVLAGIKDAKPGFLLLSAGLLFLMQVLRSYRWGLILKPLIKVDPLTLFSITSVGFLAIAAVPARIGELARPYLISRKTNLPLSAGIGSVIVERILDVLSIFLVLSVAVFFFPIPPWMIRGSAFLFMAMILSAAALLAVLGKNAPPRFLMKGMDRLPEKFSGKLREWTGQLMQGLAAFREKGLIFYLAVLSLAIWSLDALALYALFLALDIPLSLAAAYALLAIIIAGITIPTAPGFIGNWHFFCVLGLTLFGIPRTDALTYAILNHFISMAVIFSLGLLFLPSNMDMFSLRKKP